MMYLHGPSMKKYRDDLAGFIRDDRPAVAGSATGSADAGEGVVVRDHQRRWRGPARPGSRRAGEQLAQSRSALAAPVTSHSRCRARSSAGSVSVMRRRPWYSPRHARRRGRAPRAPDRPAPATPCARRCRARVARGRAQRPAAVLLEQSLVVAGRRARGRRRRPASRAGWREGSGPSVDQDLLESRQVAARVAAAARCARPPAPRGVGPTAGRVARSCSQHQPRRLAAAERDQRTRRVRATAVAAGGRDLVAPPARRTLRHRARGFRRMARRRSRAGRTSRRSARPCARPRRAPSCRARTARPAGRSRAGDRRCPTRPRPSPAARTASASPRIASPSSRSYGVISSACELQAYSSISLAGHRLARRLDARAERDRDAVGPEAEAQVVGARRQRLVEQPLRRPAERRHHLGGGHRQALAGAHEERHVGPAPGVDVEAQRGVGLDVGVRRDAVLARGSPRTGRARCRGAPGAGSRAAPWSSRRAAPRRPCRPAAPSRGSPAPGAGGSAPRRAPRRVPRRAGRGPRRRTSRPS